MPGPAPKHPSVRQRRNNAKKDFRSLPAEGRQGDAPAWPLLPDLSLTAKLEFNRDRIADLQLKYESEEDGRKKGGIRRNLDKAEMEVAQLELIIEQARDAEVGLWIELWATPQAVIWEEAHAEREVAQYVRWKIRGEAGDLEASKEARMLSDRLGLNPLALLRLRAEIENVDEREDKGQQRRQRAEPAKPKAKKKTDPRQRYLKAVEDPDDKTG